MPVGPEEWEWDAAIMTALPYAASLFNRPATSLH